MPHREYDIVLYGASGFAARYVIKELEKSELRVALAARSGARIPETRLPRMECSVDALQTLTSRTRLLINLVGPYASTGRSIVSACVSTSTHYLDISGETQFLRDTFHTFDEDAKGCGIKVVQGCGFDSVPADIGAMLLSRYFDTLLIDSTVRVWNARINKGTWMSLLGSLRAHRRRKTEDPRHGAQDAPDILKTRAQTYRYNRQTRSYDVSFRSSDCYVVARSSRYFRESGLCTFKYIAYLNIGSLFSLVVYLVFGSLVALMARFSLGYSLLARHPRLCSLGIVSEDGPSHQETRDSRFEVVLNGTGYRNQVLTTKSLTVAGPDPGYVSTSIFVTECAYLLLENEDSIAHGVLTPAQAYHRTDIVERLRARGVRFQLQDTPGPERRGHVI